MYCCTLDRCNKHHFFLVILVLLHRCFQACFTRRVHLEYRLHFVFRVLRASGYWRPKHCEYWEYEQYRARVQAVPAVSNPEILGVQTVSAQPRNTASTRSCNPEVLPVLFKYSSSSHRKYFSPTPTHATVSDCFLQNDGHDRQGAQMVQVHFTLRLYSDTASTCSTRNTEPRNIRSAKSIHSNEPRNTASTRSIRST